MAVHFTIKRILKDHWDSFLEETPNVRSVVFDEVDRVLSCGDPKMGFALYKCPRCESVRFVPFRCHSRFCSTCGTAYQDNRAASIEEKLINCRHRHIVFTISDELRPYFRADRNLLNVLFRSAAQVIHDTEGACGKVTPWKSFHHFPYTMLRKRWMTTLLANLESSIDFSRNSSVKFTNLVNRLCHNYDNGFYVHTPASDFNSASKVTKYIVRYIGRPAMARSRITDYDGKQVTFWYQRHEDNKKVVETISAHDFIKRLIIHIPEKGFNMLRYYGLYAQPYSKNSHLIRKINPQKKNCPKHYAALGFSYQSIFRT